MIDWTGVRERVEQLAHAPQRSSVFGSGSHRFVLEPPLTRTELAEVHEQLGVQLPEEYQEFLRTVSRGGAGPYYGVFALRRGPGGRWSWHGEGAERTDLDQLAAPFPLAHPHARALDDHDDRYPHEDDFDTEDQYDEARSEWNSQRLDLFLDPIRTAGAVCLCHHGCGWTQWLVVTGPERGHMWDDGRAEDEDLSPVSHPDGSRVTFGQWYLAWLDQATAASRSLP
ncbi:SMI1/KNR4 family protein [Krasilnikovia sp. MM14-A1004]|uniref:SMI1/KNR4 family protein n=1 Tax=Krasilnikovia sp. MM14-A1004 TaxID=3373541 RepID=UPI00399C5C2B